MTLDQFEQIELYRIVGMKLKLRRDLLKLSIEELSKETGICIEDLILIEGGSVENGSFLKLLQVLRMKYGVSLNRLLVNEGNVFSCKTPAIDETFYKQNMELFGNKPSPVKEKKSIKNNIIEMISTLTVKSK